MANVWKFQVALTGWVGAPGVNTWYATQDELGGTNADAFAGLIHSFYVATKDYFVNGWTAQVVPVVRRFDSDSGNLLDVDGLTARAAVTSATGTTDGNLPRDAMMKVRLLTDTIRANRVLAGGHFLGPVQEGAFDAAGQVVAGYRTAVIAAYAPLIAGTPELKLAVWGQPGPGAPPAALGRVVAASVNATPGTLRSRKT